MQFVPSFLALQIRQMGGHGHETMFIKPSRFQWDKFKDMLHYFVMVGLIPITAIVGYCNIFIGPAQLAEIPQDYEPKHWEYHNVSRLLSRVSQKCKKPLFSTQSPASWLDTSTHLPNKSTRKCVMLYTRRMKRLS